MKINETALHESYQNFKSFLEEEGKVPFTNFSHPYIIKEEYYKYDILKLAHQALRLKDREIWRENNLGKGLIIDKIIDSIEIKENNLLQWDNRWGENGKQHKFILQAKRDKKDLLKLETLFFNLFKNNQNDEKSFGQFLNFTKDYRLISYFFFLKKGDKYMPIVPNTFDRIFELTGISEYRASGNSNYENYLTYNNIIKQIQEYLQMRSGASVTLLDAHTFLWILRKTFEGEDTKSEKTKQKKKSAPIKEQIITKVYDLIEYGAKPHIPVKSQQDQSNNSFNESNGNNIVTEEEFLERYLKQVENGKKSEEIVLKLEQDYFNALNLIDLANKVKSVSDNTSLGFDILSWEIEPDTGKVHQKQIEVKTVQKRNKKIKFILTQNELNKSKILSNYHIYCVFNQDSDNPEIFYLKQPNLADSSIFKLEPINYNVSYEVE